MDEMSKDFEKANITFKATETFHVSAEDLEEKMEELKVSVSRMRSTLIYPDIYSNLQSHCCCYYHLNVHTIVLI